MVLALIALYLLPTFIVLARRHRNAGAIIALDLLLGWTLIGWVAALVWSLTWQPPRLTVDGDAIAIEPPAAARNVGIGSTPLKRDYVVLAIVGLVCLVAAGFYLAGSPA